MALSFAIPTTRNQADYSWVAGNKRHKIRNITLDGSYVNGTGWTVTPANFGLSSIVNVRLSNPSGFVFDFNPANNTLRAYSAMGTEAANNLAGLNGLVLRAEAIGF